MSELVKRQHFVPRTYLKRFGHMKGKEAYIYAGKKEGTADEIREANVKNVALEKHLYTLPGDTVAQKMALEKFYSQELEMHYDSIYSILTDSRKNKISSAERELVISTVVTMFYRTTWWISNHKRGFAKVLEAMFELCSRTEKDYFLFEGAKFSIAEKTPDQLLKEYIDEYQPSMILRQLSSAINLISQRVKNDIIFVRKFTEENVEFITSDNPVVSVNLYGEMIDNRTIMRLPIDSKHMLLLMPQGRGKLHILNTIFRENIEEDSKVEKAFFNGEQRERSEKFVFGSYAGLVDLYKANPPKP